jgi:MGT family glycosyltransferase
MSSFVFVTFDGGGNQEPAFTAAAELGLRGHSVVFAGYESQRRRVDDLGFAFVVLPRSGSADFRSAAPGERIRLLQACVMANPDHVDDIADVVDTTGADIVVVDAVMYAALTAAEHWGLPVAALAHTTPAAHAPPPAVAARRAVFEDVSALRGRLGLSPAVTATELLNRFPVVVATLRSMDPVERGPAWSHVGPLTPAPASTDRTDRTPLPSCIGGSDPVVLVSLSTLTIYGDQTARLQAILDGLAGAAVNVVATTGPAISPSALRAPPNAVVVPFLPHGTVMSSVSACVSHAGHGTVMTALVHGVPLVCTPNAAADQPYVAGRVAELGAGVALAADARPERIGEAVEAVLRDPSYAAAARRLAAEAAAAPGAAGAATLLEGLATRPAEPDRVSTGTEVGDGTS